MKSLPIKERQKRAKDLREGRTKRLPMPDVKDGVDIKFAAQFIAERNHYPGEKLWRTTDKVKKRVRDAIDRGKLSLQDDGKLMFGELMTWACEIPEWRTGLQGMPRSFYVNEAVAPGGFGVPSTFLTPPTYEECARALSELHRKFRALLLDNEQMQAELERIRPIAEANKRTRAKRSAAGKLGGRSNTRW